MNLKKFNIKNKVFIITGGAGLLGQQHAEAIIEIGGIPILFDIDKSKLHDTKQKIDSLYNIDCQTFSGDVTSEESVNELKNYTVKKNGRLDGLINNAALNPKVETNLKNNFTRLENFNINQWNKEISIGLTGAFICSKILGPMMLRQQKGVIINISSDLGIVAPDQRLYKRNNNKNVKESPVKPITYSIIKHGLIGLTKYLATYWADLGIRSNALCPGGIQHNQSGEFIDRISNLIPMGRMAKKDEYRSAIQFLASDASSYMNGACMVIDGGRTVW